MNPTCKFVLTLALPLAMITQPVLAHDPVKDDVDITGNAALVSDYLFRGISQTWEAPALQGGVDVTAGRWHAGAWASNVSHHSYPGGGIEFDMFADVGLFQHGPWSSRFGVQAYLYPGANLDQARPALASRTLNTYEANVSLAWKHWTLKYSHVLGDYFGADVEQGYAHDTHGANYLQVDGDVSLSPDWSLHLHAGRTHYAAELVTPLASGTRDPDYVDYSVAVSYAIHPGWTLGATLSHATNAAFYADVASFRDPGRRRDLGGTRIVLGLSTSL